MGTALGALGVADRPVRQGGGLRHAGRAGRRHGRGGGARGGAQARAAQVRAARAPCFLEFRTYRFRAHSMFDAELYRDKAEVERWKQRGPIHTFTDAAEGRRACSTEDDFAAHRRARSRPRSTRRWPSPRPARWEPVDDLLRDVVHAAGAA
ncbi:MAG: thiamine pyrophosphate-dependent enzyme [Comamonadaceae bacterium]|nr:thiamine pyrophosphate-dependent enzyme [Comamonadaceae bacterium]